MVCVCVLKHNKNKSNRPSALDVHRSLVHSLRMYGKHIYIYICECAFDCVIPVFYCYSLFIKYM